MRHRSKAKTNRIEWYENVAALPADWNAALPQNHFLQRDSLDAHEGAALPHLDTVYAAIRQDEQIIAQAAFQVLTLQPEHLNKSSLKSWQYNAWRVFAKSTRPKLLVAGQLFRHDVSSFFRTDAHSPFEAFNDYRKIIRLALKKTCAQAVLVKESPEVFVPYFQHYAPEYLLLRNDSSMQLEIWDEWQTLTDYEKSLKHKYAQRLRKVRQSWEALEVRELDAVAVAENASTIYELYLQVTSNQAVRLGLLSKAFLPALKKFYGSKLKIWGIYEEGKMVAFASAWVQDRSFDMFYIGFDYARNSELQLYFNILFFAIEQAIALRKPELILGRTALEAKARVGCRPEYLHTFLFIKNPLLRTIVSRLQQRFTETTGEWENRHPFKKERAANTENTNE
jgi:hypothetical protein